MSKGRVVLVDDAAFIREVLIHLLNQNGFEVVGEAEDGEQAIEVVSSTKPDLVIMDIVMPKLSGIQATRQILNQFPDIKIVACSTENSESMVCEALDAGCVDYVTKPFKGEHLIQTLNSAMSKVPLEDNP